MLICIGRSSFHSRYALLIKDYREVIRHVLNAFPFAANSFRWLTGYWNASMTKDWPLRPSVFRTFAQQTARAAYDNILVSIMSNNHLDRIYHNMCLDGYTTPT